MLLNLPAAIFRLYFLGEINLNETTKARQFAIERHGQQKYGKRPYSFHLDQVAEIAASYGEAAVVVSFLHDVVEDTKTSLKEVESLFGRLVSECVSILTDEPGETRKDRKEKTYQKMSKVVGELELALIVKASDRLANVRACIADNKLDLFNVYLTEQDSFRSAAYRPNLCEPIWRDLDKLFELG